MAALGFDVFLVCFFAVGVEFLSPFSIPKTRHERHRQVVVDGE